MKFKDIIPNVRRIIGEKSPGIWSDQDIKDYYCEAIKRLRVGSKLLNGLIIPVNDDDELNIHDDFSDLPYSFVASRCFETDKQYYDAGTKMNEFETKRMDYIDWVEDDPVNRAILPAGKTLNDIEYQSEYIIDNYSDGRYGSFDDSNIKDDE